MAQFWKQFCQDLIAVTRSWSIRRQMLLCYVIAQLVFLSFILFLVFLNLILLRNETISRLEQTLNNQGVNNMQALVKEGGTLLYSKISEVESNFGFLSEMLQNMYFNETFPLSPDSIDDVSTCNFVYSETYQSELCFDSSVYYQVDPTINQDLLDKASIFNYFWKDIFSLSSDMIIRYYMIFDTFFLIYPGIRTENEYPSWYIDFLSKNSTRYYSEPYADTLGNSELFIMTIAQSLYDPSGNIIGVVGADISTYALYESIEDLKYLEEGDAYLVYNTGDVLRIFTSEDQVFVQNATSSYIWSSVLEDPSKSYFYLLYDEIFIVSVFPIEELGSIWFYLVLSVKESVILNYKIEIEKDINATGFIMIMVTVGSSLLSIAVIVILIYYIAGNIVEPLRGIVNFTNRINANATERDLGTLDELNKLKQGEHQVAELVQAYQSLARALITRNDNAMNNNTLRSKEKYFPPNELFNVPVPWGEQLEMIRNKR